MTNSKILIAIALCGMSLAGCARQYTIPTIETDNWTPQEEAVLQQERAESKGYARGMELAHYDPLLRGERAVLEFESAKYELTYEQRKQLDAFSAEASKYDSYEIEVRGYANSVGKEEDNNTLAERRTNAVTSYLLSQHLRPADITSVSFSEYEPAVLGDTDYGRARNRRVEVILTNTAK